MHCMIADVSVIILESNPDTKSFGPRSHNFGEELTANSRSFNKGICFCIYTNKNREFYLSSRFFNLPLDAPTLDSRNNNILHFAVNKRLNFKNTFYITAK